MKFQLPPKSWLAIFSSFLLLVACKPVSVLTESDFPCKPPSLKEPSERTKPLKISVNVDGSGSMYGYIKGSTGKNEPPRIINSRYAQTITLLDSVVNLGKGSREEVTLEHYRIGEKETQSITDSQYQKARSPEFYIKTKSNEFPEISSQIDVAIENTDSEEEDQLLILVTDLDQQGNDLNKLNKKIQQTYLNKQLPGYAVGILGIRSEYNHTVFTVNPSLYPTFKYTTEGKNIESYRPFYVVFLGHYQDIVHYVEKMQQKEPSLFEASEFSLFYPNNVVTQITTLQNLPSLPADISRPNSLNNGNVSLEVKSPPYEILDIHPRITDSTPSINYNLPYNPLQDSLLVDNRSIAIETEVFTYDFGTKNFTENNSNSLKRAIQFADWEITENNIEFTSTINLNSISNPGIYIFKINTLAKGLQDEAWWKEWDWTSRVDDKDGSKTHNLLNFMQNLKRTTIDLMEQPSFGYFCYGIQKN